MAHIYSLKVNNSLDVLNLEQNSIYTKPFKYFLSKFDYKQIDKDWQYLFFLYICFFSLKNYITYKDSNISRIIDTFIFLSSQMEKYLEFVSLKKRYFELLNEKEINSFLKSKLIFPRSIKLCYKEKQKISLAALFEVIPLIKTSAFKISKYIKHGKF